MALYKEIVDPTIQWSHFSLEEQAKARLLHGAGRAFSRSVRQVIVAPRSQCHLDVSKLKASPVFGATLAPDGWPPKAEYPELKTARDAVREAFVILRQHVDNGAPLPPKRNATK